LHSAPQYLACWTWVVWRGIFFWKNKKILHKVHMF